MSEKIIILTDEERVFVSETGGIPNLYMNGLVIKCRRDGLTVDDAIRFAVEESKKSGGKEHIRHYKNAGRFLQKHKKIFNLT